MVNRYANGPEELGENGQGPFVLATDYDPRIEELEVDLAERDMLHLDTLIERNNLRSKLANSLRTVRMGDLCLLKDVVTLRPLVNMFLFEEKLYIFEGNTFDHQFYCITDFRWYYLKAEDMVQPVEWEKS